MDLQNNLLLKLEDGLKQNANRWRSAFGMLIFCMHIIELYNLGHTMRFHLVLGLMDITRYLPWESWMKVRNVLSNVLLGNKTSNSAWSDLTKASLVEALIW